VSKLIELLKKQPMTLIVNLSESSVASAKSAEKSGADALTIRIDSSKEKSDIINIVKSVKIPVGVMIEDDAFVMESQMKALMKLHFDYFGTSVMVIRDWMLGLDGFGKVARLNQNYDLDDLTSLSDRPIDAINAAIMTKDEIGKDLTVGDLQRYINICLSTKLPVIVPTQKLIRASEIPIIWDTGAKGILMDEKIIGNKLGTFSSAIKEFRAAIDSLKE
jgi:hypothetical protein